MDLLEKINAAAATTIVMVTHDPELAARARRKLHVLDGTFDRSPGRPRARRIVIGLFYNLRLVVKSLRRDRWFTLVMVLSQALSVSIFVTALATAQRYTNASGQVASDVFRIEGERNQTLMRFYRGTQFEILGEFTANYVSVPTVRRLGATGLATASSVNFVAVLNGGPVERAPDRLAVRFCDADVFQLFNVDFRYGGPFTRADERASPPVPVVVISDLLNQKLYDGGNSVGRTIRIAGRDFRVVGVTRQRTGRMRCGLWRSARQT